MTTYRSFHNTDPPRIAELWEQSNLGPGAAGGLTVDAFEFFVFAQPFFDKEGLIVACEGDRVIGFVHAIRAVNDESTALGNSAGAIVAILVHPDFRRQGIGRELVRRGCQYLTGRGIESIELGPTTKTNGFYVGIYGGAQPQGFRNSEGAIEEFAAGTGWEPKQRYRCYQKVLTEGSRDPVNMKLIANRRKTQLDATDPANDASWWWMTRFGRMDSVQFNLVEKSSREAFANCEIFGLDLYIPKWGQRAAGLGEVRVPQKHEGNDYELSLVLEMCKYLREQLITIIDVSVSDDDVNGTRLIEAAGFEQCDQATVFSRPERTLA